MADNATATAPETRPLVPYLRLGASRDQDYLFGSRCTAQVDGSACGATYVGTRHFCGKCGGTGPFEETRLSNNGEVYVWSVIYQATPYVKAPYIAAIIDLPEGVAVNTNLEGIEPDPKNLQFGMKVEMFTEKVSEDREGNSYVAYKFRPAS